MPQRLLSSLWKIICCGSFFISADISHSHFNKFNFQAFSGAAFHIFYKTGVCPESVVSPHLDLCRIHCVVGLLVLLSYKLMLENNQNLKDRDTRYIIKKLNRHSNFLGGAGVEVIHSLQFFALENLANGGLFIEQR